jgi:hypothetical protein
MNQIVVVRNKQRKHNWFDINNFGHKCSNKRKHPKLNIHHIHYTTYTEQVDYMRLCE